MSIVISSAFFVKSLGKTCLPVWYWRVQQRRGGKKHGIVTNDESGYDEETVLTSLGRTGTRYRQHKLEGNVGGF